MNSDSHSRTETSSEVFFCTFSGNSVTFALHSDGNSSSYICRPFQLQNLSPAPGADTGPKPVWFQDFDSQPKLTQNSNTKAPNLTDFRFFKRMLTVTFSDFFKYRETFSSRRIWKLTETLFLFRWQRNVWPDFQTGFKSKDMLKLFQWKSSNNYHKSCKKQNLTDVSNWCQTLRVRSCCRTAFQDSGSEFSSVRITFIWRQHRTLLLWQL